jgi:O-acetyl-ADP-ribose deacetylase (regulator of RNase III)
MTRPPLTTTSEDLWVLHDRGWYIVDPTNLTLDSAGRNVMGAGISRQVAQRYSDAPARYGRAIVAQTAGGKAFSGRSLAPTECVGPLVIVDDERRIIFLPTKYDWRRPSILALIERAIHELATIMDSRIALRVALPRIGAGLGGLDWDRVVLPLVVKYLDGFGSQLILVDPPQRGS